MVQYDKKNIQLEYPDTWSLTEDDFDETIRAITIECPNEGIYTIDIYHKEQAPSLNSYMNRSNKYFEKELPIGSKVLHWSKPISIKALNQGHEILGKSIEFSCKSFFFMKSKYTALYFCIESQKMISMCCAQFSNDCISESTEGFKMLLNSYKAT